MRQQLLHASVVILLLSTPAFHGARGDGALERFAWPPVLIGSPLSAQTPPRADTIGPLVLLRTNRDRWIPDARDAAFVRFERSSDPIQLRTERFEPDFGLARTLDLDMRRLDARISLDERNRANRIRVELPPLSYSRYDDRKERAHWRRQRLIRIGATAFRLPESQFWEIPFPLPPGPLLPGVSWADTLAFVADPGEGLEERLEGVWRHRVVGDTVIDGSSLPVVRTEASVRYRSTERPEDRAMPGTFTVERDVSGTISGLAAVDTAAGVRAAGADTARWAGTAVLRTQNGRSFPSAVRYERYQSWTLMDPATWAVHQDSARARSLRASTGMLYLPEDRTAERLAAGDTVLADSLWSLLRATRDPDERLAIESALGRWWPKSQAEREAIQERLREVRVAAGDTAALVLSLLEGRFDTGTLTPERLDRLLPYLDDLGLQWKLGVAPDWLYHNLAGMMLTATPTLRPDTADWGCVPAACQRILEQLDRAREPRLRDVALVGAFARDPAHWHDRLRARADSGSLVVGPALSLAEGVGATWAAAPHARMPSDGADWRRWLAWMGGTVRFERSHLDAIRMYSARTGRDPLAGLQERWPPETDSARLVIGFILRQAGALERATAEELAAELRSESDVRAHAAALQLRSVLRGAPAAGDSLAASLVGPLIDSLMAGGLSPWAELRPERRTRPRRQLGEFHGTGGPVFVRSDDLSARVAAVVGTRAPLITNDEWDARPRRAGGVLVRIDAFRRAGPLVQVRWSWTAYRARKPDEAPSGFAGGTTLYLLETPDGWRVVSGGSWIT